jgi:hypothetical protein
MPGVKYFCKEPGCLAALGDLGTGPCFPWCSLVAGQWLGGVKIIKISPGGFFGKEVDADQQVCFVVVGKCSPLGLGHIDVCCPGNQDPVVFTKLPGRYLRQSEGDLFFHDVARRDDPRVLAAVPRIQYYLFPECFNGQCMARGRETCCQQQADEDSPGKIFGQFS